MTTPTSGTNAPQRSEPTHARALRSRRLLRGVALSLTGILAFGTAAAGAYYYVLESSLDKVDPTALLGTDRPPPAPVDPSDPNADRPLNILVIGSDDRSGENAALGGETPGKNSDTTIVLHISADRSRVELVSIPRDSLVDVPECLATGGKVVPARKAAMFNSAFGYGWNAGQDAVSGIACTQKTVESLVGFQMDSSVMIDFVGFTAMVEALGGVPITLESAITSPDADNLVLPAGYQVLDAKQALGLVRARKGTGAGMDGSDLHRIDRQQDVMQAMAKAALGKNLVTDAPSLLSFLAAATSSLTVGGNLSSVPDLAGLILSLKGVAPEDMVFTTVPNKRAPSDKNRVVWTDEADELWRRMAADEPIMDPVDEGETPGAPAPIS